MNLPEDILAACAPLFEKRPLETAMRSLVGSDPKETQIVDEILRRPALAACPELAAGLWLYVDDLDRSHTISQSIESATGSFWHGIMHRREGDSSNSLYWMRRAATHPLFEELDPASLVRDVSQSGGVNSPELVARQQNEWAALFAWCARQK